MVSGRVKSSQKVYSAIATRQLAGTASDTSGLLHGAGYLPNTRKPLFPPPSNYPLPLYSILHMQAVKWLKENDDEARAISAAGRKLALQVLTVSPPAFSCGYDYAFAVSPLPLPLSCRSPNPPLVTVLKPAVLFTPNPSPS